MIYLMSGPPGSGKSYEAVVFHVLEAVKKGRKVITNLPLNIDLFSKIDPSYESLIEIRKGGRTDRFGSEVSDYIDEWRHEKTQRGPLIIIDECHLSIPKIGTSSEVSDFYVEHRHYGLDILLMTAAVSKVCPDIISLVELYYKVRNTRSLGSDKGYIRKTHMGFRGEVLSEQVRFYDKNYFPLYRSHTASNSAVKESLPTDIVPFWKKWWVLASLPLMIFGLFFSVTSFKKITRDKNLPEKVEEGPALAGGASTSLEEIPLLEHPFFKQAQPEPEPEPEPQPVRDEYHPFQSTTIHIAGYIGKEGKDLYLIVLAQNGQPVRQLTSDDLVKAGYSFRANGVCSMELNYGTNFKRFISCDLPTNTPVVMAASRP